MLLEGNDTGSSPMDTGCTAFSFSRRGRPPGIAEEIEIRAVSEDAVALLSGGFLQQPELREAGDETVGSGVGNAQEPLDFRHAAKGVPVEALEDAVTVAGGSPESVGDALAVVLPQGQNLTGGPGGLAACVDNAFDEEVEPALPVPEVAHGLQSPVVFIAVLHEIMGETKHRMPKNILLMEKKGDQQPSDEPVAVGEWMDDLELRMSEADLYQFRQVAGVVQEVLEGAERGRDLIGVGRRWCEGEIVRGAVRHPDPVSGPTQLTGLRPAAARSGQETFVDLVDQGDAQRQFPQAFEAVVHRLHIVDDFAGVGGPVRRGNAGLGGEDIPQGASGALDPAGEYRLPAHVQEDEAVRLGENPDGAVKTSQGAVGASEEALKFALHTNRGVGRQRPRDRRAIAGNLAPVTTGPLPRVQTRVGFRFHIALRLLWWDLDFILN